MRDDMEVRSQQQSQGLSDKELLMTMMAPVDTNLPAKVTPGYGDDPFGLVRHERMHESAAERVFDALSYMFEQTAEHNTEVRDAIATGTEAELPHVRFETSELTHNEFGLRRKVNKDTGGITFEIYRADIGNKKGGFYVIRNYDGSTIVRRDEVGEYHERVFEDDPEQAKLIHIAMATVMACAEKLNISQTAIKNNMFDDHLTDETIARFTKERLYEKKLRYKALKTGQIAVNTTVDFFDKTFRKPEVDNENDPRYDNRVLRKGRVALAGLLLTAGMSQVMTGSAIPRPAIEAASVSYDTVAGALSSDEEGPTGPDPVDVYNDLGINLPAEAALEVGAGSQPIALLTELPEGIEDAPVIDSGELGADNALTAGSPAQVRIRESLGPNQCARLPIDESIQGEPYSFATTEPLIARSASVEAGVSAITVCNDSDEILAFDQLGSFYFDIDAAPAA